MRPPSDFGNDLLRGIHAQTGHLGESLHRILVRAEQRRHFLVELADLLFDQSQFLEHQGEESPIDGVEVRARAERVAQLFLRGTQALIRQRRQRGWTGFPVSQRLQYAPGTGAQQIRDQAGQLNMGFLQQTLQSVL